MTYRENKFIFTVTEIRLFEVRAWHLMPALLPGRYMVEGRRRKENVYFHAPISVWMGV